MPVYPDDEAIVLRPYFTRNAWAERGGLYRYSKGPRQLR